MTTLRLRHEGNTGYAADQIDGEWTLGALLDAVQAAIDEHGEDARIVTYQTNNGYGAQYGNLPFDDLFTTDDDDEEEW